ncbi:ATP-dependent helicase [Desulfofundulus salinus]|uniref:DNA 3'-5' helicase n=1 Tax=Desulfofundulus salinus TaxID=2419843 RepID=A0A494WU51_9FIRM|nr:ATP-dependent DNA helicase [Desulfofundulus salinum]RKO66343.1 ATP-dependent helicase [Desulfofundulus salinum]
MRYTEKQLEAINHRGGNLLILACAGSGKTEVIARRIAMLVSEGVPRDSIVAFTFTERAAGELKARIRRHLDELRREGRLDDAALGSMYVGTIHSFCLQLLKEMDPRYRNFEILDDVKQVAFIVSNYLDYGGRGLGLERLENGRSRIETVEAFLNTLNRMYIENIPVASVRNPVLRDVLIRYHNLTRSRPNYFLDFDSIIAETLEFLHSNPSVRKEVQEKFRHIVVDEYQDVDPRQEELIRLLSTDGTGAEVCVVGDDDQSIYAWRGADISNILTFEERYPRVKKIELTDNFRSTHCIVEIANRAVRGDSRRGHAVRGLSRRLDKDMRARKYDPESDRFVETMAELGDVHRLVFGSEEEEASFIAAEIERLRGLQIEDRDGVRGLDYGDIAVLYRSVKNGVRTLMRELDAKGIPYVVRGTTGLFDHSEVRLFQAAFCFLARMRCSFRDSETGEVTNLNEADIRDFIRKTVEEMRDRGIMPHANPAIFLEWLASKRRELGLSALPRGRRPRGVGRRIYPQDLFQEMLEILGANRGPEPWPDNVLYNLGRFSDLITRFESVHQWVTPQDLWDLNYFLGTWASRKSEEGGLDDPSLQNAVQIMTVHQSKGLEWPVVFLPGLTSRRFPSQKRYSGQEVLLEDDEYIGRRSLGKNDPDRILRDDEERRLWYVAVTRCRKFLYLTCFTRRGTGPSPYFAEIEHDYVLDENTDPSSPRPRTVPRRPANTELLPTTYSDLNYYWACPYDYKLRRLMGFSPGVREDYGYGQQIHNLLALIHERAKKGGVDEEWVKEEVGRRFNLRYTTGDPFEKMKNAAERTLVRYVTEFPDIEHYVFEAEKPFEFIMGDAMISGTIDLLNRVENVDQNEESSRTPVEVVDFKTKRNGDDLPLEDRLKDASMQVVLYAIAAEESLGYDAREGSVHFLYADRPQDRVSVDISETARNKVREAVANAVNGIKEGRFPRTGIETGRCKECDYKSLCPGSAACGKNEGEKG